MFTALGRSGVNSACKLNSALRMRSRPLLVVLLLAAAVPACAMRLVLQRVKSASVIVNDAVVSSIGRGVVALVGLHVADDDDELQYCARKLCGSKLWANRDGKGWRQSVKQMDYEVLLVSQFTLYGEVTNKKHTPDFKKAMKSEQALETYTAFKAAVAAEYGSSEDKIKDGVFGAMMDVQLVNDGPVTLIIDSPDASDIWTS